MKWPVCLAIPALFSAAACSGPAPRSALPSGVPRLPASIRIGVKDSNRVTIRKVPFEEYVQATMLSEFAPPSGDPATVERMLEVQAVIARTYAVAHLGRHSADGYDLCATTHCQLFEPSRIQTPRWAPVSAEAVRETQYLLGKVLDGEQRQALFKDGDPLPDRRFSQR